jgi:hypothetical protein
MAEIPTIPPARIPPPRTVIPPPSLPLPGYDRGTTRQAVATLLDEVARVQRARREARPASAAPGHLPMRARPVGRTAKGGGR